MTAEIISVGTELLLGEIVNTDAACIARELAALGIAVYHQSTVGDNPQRLRDCFRQAIGRSDVVILSGGLGPTDDDLTKQAVCDELGLDTYTDQISLDRIKEHFARSGREMTENNRSQAILPVGCTVFNNENGTAPGFAVEHDGKRVVLLPGPPRELEPMMKNSVVPYLARLSDSVIVTHDINIFGIGESKVAEILGDITESTEPTVALYCGDGEVRARVAAHAADTKAADDICRPMINKICAEFGSNVYGIDAESLEKAVVTALKSSGKSVATAESCTGGLLSKRLTAISGSSEVFELGVVSYSGRIKNQVLGVDADTIERLGTVCAPVARMMAQGVRRAAGADLGVGITGVAGSPFEGKPTGLVYIAVADGEKVYMRRLAAGRRPQEREYIRHIASSNALDMLRLYLSGDADFLAGGMTDAESDTFFKE